MDRLAEAARLRKRYGVHMLEIDSDRVELEQINLREESTLRSEHNNCDQQADSLSNGVIDNNKHSNNIRKIYDTSLEYSDSKFKGKNGGTFSQQQQQQQSQSLQNDQNSKIQMNIVATSLPQQQLISINQLTANNRGYSKNSQQSPSAFHNSFNDSAAQPINVLTNPNTTHNNSYTNIKNPHEEYNGDDSKELGIQLFQSDSVLPAAQKKKDILKNIDFQTANFNLLASLNTSNNEDAISPQPADTSDKQQINKFVFHDNQNIVVDLLPTLQNNNHSKIAGSVATEEEDTNGQINRKNLADPKGSIPLQSSFNAGARPFNKEDSHEDQGNFNRMLGVSTRYQKTKKQKNNTSLNYFDRIKIMSSVKPKIKRFFELRTVSGRTKALTDVIRSYINDTSDYHVSSKGSMNAFVTFFKKLLVQLLILLRLNKIPIFNPESKVKIIFNTIIVTYSCFYLFISSLQIFFHADFGELTTTFHEIALVGWITEMVLEMNTAMYHHNIFITDRRIIMKIYLKEYFFFEILPLIFEGRTSETLVFNILLHLPLLLKIKGMMTNLEKLEFYILQLLNKQHFFQLFKLIMQMLLLSHIVACLWNCVLQSELKFFHPATTWVEASHILDGTWWKTYIYAQYWAFTTMKNIGTVPNTVEELVFTSFCMILSCIAFGYLLNAIGLIISDITKSQEEYKKDLNILNSFMKRKEIDLGLKRRVNINLKKFYEQQRLEKFSTEREILGKLTPKLVGEVIEQSSSKILKNFPFFYKLFSEGTITKLYGIMEEVILTPSQIVYDKNKCIDPSFSIYLIVKGSVLYYAETSAKHEEDSYNLQSVQTMQGSLKQSDEDPKDKKEGNEQEDQQVITNRHNHHYKKKVKVLTQGQSFGVVGFFTGKERLMNVQSNEYSTVIKIERSKFLEILQDNENDYEKFMEVKDKLLFDGCFDDLLLSCYICGSKEHLSSNCSKVHFDRSNKHVFYKFNCSVPQVRNTRYLRTNYSPFKALLRQKRVKQEAYIFKENNSFIWDTEENENLDDGEDMEQSNIDDDREQTSEEGDDDNQTESVQQPRHRKASSATANNYQHSSNSYSNNIIGMQDDNQRVKRISYEDEQRQFEQCESEICSPPQQPNVSHNSSKQIQLHFGLQDGQEPSQRIQLNNNNAKNPYESSDLQRLRPKRLSTNAPEVNFESSEEGSRYQDTSKKISHGTQRKGQASPGRNKLKGSLLTIEEKERQPSILNHFEGRDPKKGRDAVNDLAKIIAASIQDQLHPIVNTQTQITFSQINQNNTTPSNAQGNHYKTMPSDGHILINEGEKVHLKQSQKRAKSSFNPLQASQYQTRYDNSTNLKSSIFVNSNNNNNNNINNNMNSLANNQTGYTSSATGLQSALKTGGNNGFYNGNNFFNSHQGNSLGGNNLPFPGNFSINNGNFSNQQQQLLQFQQQFLQQLLNLTSGNNNNNNMNFLPNNNLSNPNNFSTSNGLNQMLRSNTFHSLNKNLSIQQFPMNQLEQQNFLWSMEICKSYTFYYPQYNLAEVLKRQNIAIAKRRKIKRRSKTFVDGKTKKSRHPTVYQPSKNDVLSQCILNN